MSRGNDCSRWSCRRKASTASLFCAPMIGTFIFLSERSKYMKAHGTWSLLIDIDLCKTLRQASKKPNLKASSITCLFSLSIQLFLLLCSYVFLLLLFRHFSGFWYQPPRQKPLYDMLLCLLLPCAGCLYKYVEI